MRVEYSSNNSGGSWWLNDKHWKALEDAGWEVEWGSLWFCRSAWNVGRMRPAYLTRECKGKKGCSGHRVFQSFDEAMAAGGDGRWLGALATKATRRGLTLRAAADEWERVTGLSATDAGCACCGQPHNFTEYDDSGKYIASGPETSYEAHW